MMGPFLMAGLTKDTRTIAASPGEIEGLLQDADSSGLISLQLAANVPQASGPNGQWVQQSGDGVTLARAGSSVADLSSTFRLVSVPANDR